MIETDYATTSILDRLREREFARLDATGHVYLDYTGSGLYGESQVRRHAESLLQEVFGNPHSDNPASRASTRRVEHCRQRVLSFFHADPAEYAVVFTANASHALKLVGESWPFEPGARFLLTFDNHNSVNGIREYDRACGACTTYVPLTLPDLRVDREVLLSHLQEADPGRPNLFAYPAQSNFSGVRHPLEWIELAQGHGWTVLLDAAAFVPTARLDLGAYKPDFVCLSFYKMFGYPTGVGALLARRQALAKLHRPWFAGGNVRLASVQADRHLLADAPEGFEDGTLDFTQIPAVELGLDLIEEVGYDVLAQRVRFLTGWLLEEFGRLRHANGAPVVRVYGPQDTQGRGGTLAVNFLHADGSQVDHSDVEYRADRRRISVRTGCFCNPGAGELALGFTAPQMQKCMDSAPRSGSGCSDLRRCLDPRGGGAVRISFGLASNLADAQACLELAREFRG